MNQPINTIKFPSWIVRTVAGVILVGLLAWAKSLQARDVVIEGRVTKLETHYEHIQSDMSEIKNGQRLILQKLA